MQHYRSDTLFYIKNKILPSADLLGIRSIFFWYSSNSKEKAELTVSDAAELFETMIEKAIQILKNQNKVTIWDMKYATNIMSSLGEF